jgi:hypothetical protein
LVRKHEFGQLEGIDAIFFDPIYQLYEGDWEENKNEDMAKLGKYLREISELSEISTVFAHHHSKGNQNGRRGIEMSSGGGTLGRFVAANLAISSIGQDTTSNYKLVFTNSHFPKQPEEVWSRDGLVWTPTGLDPETVSTSKFTVSDIMAYLPDDGLKNSAWLEQCQIGLRDAKGMITEDAHRTVRDKAKNQGFVYYAGKKNGDKWVPTSKWLERQDVPPAEDYEEVALI